MATWCIMFMSEMSRTKVKTKSMIIKTAVLAITSLFYNNMNSKGLGQFLTDVGFVVVGGKKAAILSR